MKPLNLQAKLLSNARRRLDSLERKSATNSCAALDSATEQINSRSPNNEKWSRQDDDSHDGPVSSTSALDFKVGEEGRGLLDPCASEDAASRVNNIKSRMDHSEVHNYNDDQKRNRMNSMVKNRDIPLGNLCPGSNGGNRSHRNFADDPSAAESSGYTPPSSFDSATQRFNYIGNRSINQGPGSISNDAKSYDYRGNCGISTIASASPDIGAQRTGYEICEYGRAPENSEIPNASIPQAQTDSTNINPWLLGTLCEPVDHYDDIEKAYKSEHSQPRLSIEASPHLRTHSEPHEPHYHTASTNEIQFRRMNLARRHNGPPEDYSETKNDYVSEDVYKASVAANSITGDPNPFFSTSPSAEISSYHLSPSLETSHNYKDMRRTNNRGYNGISKSLTHENGAYAHKNDYIDSTSHIPKDQRPRDILASDGIYVNEETLNAYEKTNVYFQTPTDVKSLLPLTSNEGIASSTYINSHSATTSSPLKCEAVHPDVYGLPQKSSARVRTSCEEKATPLAQYTLSGTSVKNGSEAHHGGNRRYLGSSSDTSIIVAVEPLETKKSSCSTLGSPENLAKASPDSLESSNLSKKKGELNNVLQANEADGHKSYSSFTDIPRSRSIPLIDDFPNHGTIYSEPRSGSYYKKVQPRSAPCENLDYNLRSPLRDKPVHEHCPLVPSSETYQNQERIINFVNEIDHALHQFACKLSDCPRLELAEDFKRIVCLFENFKSCIPTTFNGVSGDSVLDSTEITPVQSSSLDLRSLIKFTDRTTGSSLSDENPIYRSSALYENSLNAPEENNLYREIVSVLSREPEGEYIELSRNQIKLFYDAWAGEVMKNNVFRSVISRLNYSFCANFNEILDDFDVVVNTLGNISECLALEKTKSDKALGYIKSIHRQYDELVKENMELRQKFNDSNKAKADSDAEIIRRIKNVENALNYTG